jgi:hypothetical protein
MNSGTLSLPSSAKSRSSAGRSAASLLSQPEFDDVHFIHAVGEVELRAIRRSDRGDRRDRDHTVRRPAAVASACRPSPERPHVAKCSSPSAFAIASTSCTTSATTRSGVPRRIAVAGTVVREQTDALLPRHLDVLVERHTGSGRSVVEENRTAVRVTRVVHRERAAVRRPDRQLLHPPSLQRSDPKGGGQRGCGTMRM